MPDFVITPDITDLISRESNLATRILNIETDIAELGKQRIENHADYQILKEEVTRANKLLIDHETGVIGKADITVEPYASMYKALLLTDRAYTERLAQFRASPIHAIVDLGTGNLRRTKEAITEVRRQRIHYQNRIVRHTEERAVTRQSLALAQMQPIKTIGVDIEQLHASLSRHPVVTHIKSWETITNDNETPETKALYLRLHLAPIEMEPSADCEDCESEGHQENCETFGPEQMPASALSFMWRMNQLRPQVVHLTGTRFKGYDNKALVHPHWIQAENPCLGDFGDAIGAAIADGQIYSMILIYLEYLQQYNQCDPAGKLAPRWSLNKSSQHIRSIDEIKSPHTRPEETDACKVHNFKLTENPTTTFIGPKKKKETSHDAA